MVWQKHYSPPGAAPGILVSPPDAPQEVHIAAYHFTDKQCTEEMVTDLGAYLSTMSDQGVLWLDIAGLGDVEVIRMLGQHYDFHVLALEDVLNVPQRPKFEEYDTHFFLVFRLAPSNDDDTPEQVSLFVGPSYVVSVRQHPHRVFSGVQRRMRQPKSRLRKSGSDYLGYALLDAAIDSFFPYLEMLGERLAELEDEVLSAPNQQTLANLYALRRVLSALRRGLWPLQEVVNELMRSDMEWITDQTRLYLRDCADHIMQLLDVLDSYRELVSGLTDTYLSMQSQSLNEVMKVLTIIATLFIPLTFIAGIYGMNFDPAKSPLNMPELSWYWGYPFSLGLMAVVSAGLIFYFKRKGWF